MGKDSKEIKYMLIKLRWWVIGVVLLLLAGGWYLHLQTRDARADNHLSGRLPVSLSALPHVERITDSRVGQEGDNWDSESSVILPPGSQLDYDLGALRQIGCLWIQADNNDYYRVEFSRDGINYAPLWDAPPIAGAGLRLRFVERVTDARYLRLRAAEGDAHYSMSEFGAAAHCPQHEPMGLAWGLSLPHITQSTDRLLLLAALFLVCVVWRSHATPRWLSLALVIVTGGWVMTCAWTLYRGYPIFHAESALRAALALVTGAIGLHEAWHVPDARQRRLHTALLSSLAVLALGCYYHFGALQFHDAAKARQSFVHTFDMRHYFPVAKYFPELRFDGLYLASLAAYVDETGISAAQLPNVRLRDLTTNDMRYAPDVADRLDAIRARFSAARWHEFRRDMRYFMDTMGGDYLSSMQDHGGNATPVWVLGAWLLFNSLPANEWTLSLSGLLDPLLLAILFVVIARSFGLRTMLYCMILFGATDFYQFGSNLVGSTLRQDWLVALGLGACALKGGRYWLGGALLAYAGLVRAFPAMAIFFLLVPIGWWLLDVLRRGAYPALPRLWHEQHAVIKTGLAAFVTVVVLMVASTATFGWQNSWGAWLDKIRIHAVGPSVNNVGLRNVMSYDPKLAARHVLVRDHPEPWVEWQRTQAKTYAARRPYTYAILLATLLLAVLAARRRPLHEATLLGLLTIPFVFYPSNYYCHFIFLLPLAFTGRLQCWVVVALAALCAGQYFTLFENWSDERYTYQSFLLLAAFWLILLPAAWRGLRQDKLVAS